MSKTPSQTVCLAVLIKPNTPISTLTLLSAKPFIDNWVICSAGLEPQQERQIKTTLVGSDGIFITHEMNHYGDAKTRLVQCAQEHADWVLVLNMTEELCTFRTSIDLPQNNKVGMIEVARNTTKSSHTNLSKEARLFAANCKVAFEYPAAEQADFADEEVSFVNSVTLHSHQDRPDWCDDKIANRFLIDAVLGKFEPSADLSLALGKIELTNNQQDLALAHLERAITLATNKSQPWMAHYLAGNICSKSKNSTGAIAHWQAAFELEPGRAESLFRLAELHFNARDFKTAALLAEHASATTVPAEAAYREPAIYSHLANILVAQCWHQLERSNEAIKLLNTALQKNTNKGIKTELQTALDKIILSVEQETNKKPTNATKTATKQKDVAHKRQSHFVNENIPKLTIGMATHDDFDGVYFSVMSLVLYHQDCLDEIEILLIDNNPNSKHGKAVRSLADRVTHMRYVAAEEYTGTAIRERVFHEARGEYVVCMDCHVFLHDGAVRRLIDYFDENPNSKDILHGPIYYDNHDNYSTHMNSEWCEGFYGRWGTNEQGGKLDNEPFEIPMQGLGLFACVKDKWPGFNLKFRGFGGEEGYIHEKFRQHGGRALCLPFLRWTHRFDRPNAPTYSNSWEDRVRNYLIGWDELQLDTTPILEHFSDMLGEYNTSAMFTRFLTEKSSPFWHFDNILIYSDTEFEQPMLNCFGAQRITRTTNSQEDLNIFLEQAINHKLPNVLLIIAKTSSKREFESAITESIATFTQLKSNIIHAIDTDFLQATLLDHKTIPALIDSLTNCDIRNLSFAPNELDRLTATAV